MKYIREIQDDYVSLLVVKPLGNQYRTLVPTVDKTYNVVMNVTSEGWSTVFYPWNDDTVYGKLENPEYFNNVSYIRYPKGTKSIQVFKDTIDDFLDKTNTGLHVRDIDLFSSVYPVIPIIKSKPLLKRHRVLDKKWNAYRATNGETGMNWIEGYIYTKE